MELELKNIQNYPLQGNNLKVVDPNGYTASIVGIITTDPFVQVDFDTAQDDVIIRVMYEDGDHKPDYDFATWGISQIKPLLLPMSSLYKEMEDGTVPIVELFKMYETRVFDKDKKYSIVFDTPIVSYEWAVYDTIKKEEGILKYIRKTGNMGDLVHSFRYDPELRRFSMYDDSNRRPLAIAYQLDLFTYLFSHHFDVFSLIDNGLAIDKTKIK